MPVIPASKITTQKFLFKDVNRSVGTLFSLIGVVFLCVSIFTFINSARFYANAVPVEGVIGSISPNQQVMVTYEAEGQTQTAALGFYSSSMRVGDTIPLYYSLDDPASIRTTSSQILSWIFLGLGGLLAVIGLTMLVLSIRKQGQNQSLVKNGQRLDAVVVNIGVNTRISNNYRHPYILDCQYQDANGMVHLFHSGPVWFDPSGLIGSYIPVYVERNNYEKYYVDIQALEKQYKQH